MVLPVLKSGSTPSQTRRPKVKSVSLPNATLIYGVGAGVLLAISLYYIFTGLWFTGVLLLPPAGALIGFALHFLKGNV